MARLGRALAIAQRSPDLYAALLLLTAHEVEDLHVSHLLHRQLRGTLPLAAGGHGVYIVDADGREYIDAFDGAAVSCLGHGHPDVVQAIHEQID